MASKYVYLIGNPLDHTKSQALHNAYFKKHKLDVELHKCELNPDEFRKRAKLLLQDNKCIGANIASPYKTIAHELCDELHETSKKSGAVSTIVRHKNGMLIGFNSDVKSIINTIYKLINAPENPFAKPDRVVIIGNGGVARALVYSLMSEWGVRRIVLAVRDMNSARGLMSLSRKFDINTEVSILPLDKLNVWCKQQLIPAPVPALRGNPKLVGRPKPEPVPKWWLINATPVGQNSKDEMPVSDDTIPSCFDHVIDLVYNPEKTALIKLAQANDLKVATGVEFLHFKMIDTRLLWGLQKDTSELYNFKKDIILPE